MLNPAGRSRDNKSGANQDKEKVLAPVRKHLIRLSSKALISKKFKCQKARD